MLSFVRCSCGRMQETAVGGRLFGAETEGCLGSEEGRKGGHYIGINN